MSKRTGFNYVIKDYPGYVSDWGSYGYMIGWTEDVSQAMRFTVEDIIDYQSILTQWLWTMIRQGWKPRIENLDNGTEVTTSAVFKLQEDYWLWRRFSLSGSPNLPR